ncbi:MAG: DM13 domain-containing protein [Anaerolineae bacterium]|nr:DM13 domain-containing protein [Anaerolineae bacterium]
MRTRWFVLLLGGLLVAALFAFPLWWPVINRSPVADALPGLTDLPADQQAVIEEIAREDIAFAAALIDGWLAGPEVVPEEEQMMPDMQGPSLYKSGEFTTIDAVRRAEGTAQVYQLADSSWMVRLEGFEVRNGPQLHLVLSAHPQPRTPEEVREGGLGLDWGPLKGTVGNQNFPLPAGFDMAAVRSVVIFSIPYQEVFSSAQLF